MIETEIYSEQKSVEQMFMTDYWKFRKKYYNPEDSDDYWREVCAAADELYRQYPGEYFKEIIMTGINDLDKRYRAVKRNTA